MAPLSNKGISHNPVITHSPTNTGLRMAANVFVSWWNPVQTLTSVLSDLISSSSLSSPRWDLNASQTPFRAALGIMGPCSFCCVNSNPPWATNTERPTQLMTSDLLQCHNESIIVSYASVSICLFVWGNNINTDHHITMCLISNRTLYSMCFRFQYLLTNCVFVCKLQSFLHQDRPKDHNCVKLIQ